MGNYRRELYASKTASEVTSETYWVGDAQELTVQLLGSPSTTTIQGTNVDGRSAAIAETDWSTISTVIGDGIVNIEPGWRWMRGLRSETTAMHVNWRYQP
ncbi:MAG: hypothetical protein R3268_00790 [Acidiferrobacterales bacterium]|nr:hypothetical protein [Acidiferrobacterales bacterium]